MLSAYSLAHGLVCYCVPCALPEEMKKKDGATRMMKYKVIVQAHTICTAEESNGGVIGAKEHIASILERLGMTVDYINVIPEGKITER